MKELNLNHRIGTLLLASLDDLDPLPVRVTCPMALGGNSVYSVALETVYRGSWPPASKVNMFYSHARELCLWYCMRILPLQGSSVLNVTIVRVKVGGTVIRYISSPLYMYLTRWQEQKNFRFHLKRLYVMNFFPTN